MFLAQSCPHGSYSIFYTSTVGRDNIHETFHQIEFCDLTRSLFCLVQMIQFVTLVKNCSGTTIFVFGTLIIDFLPNTT